MKTKIDIKKFLLVIFWIKIYCELYNKKFNYQNILDQAETYNLSNTQWDTNIHNIDYFMKDVFDIYCRMQEVKIQYNDSIIDLLLNKSDLIEETSKFENICEDLLINYKYEEPEIRGIQRTYLIANNKMAECIKNEDYEGAANIRDILKN